MKKHIKVLLISAGLIIIVFIIIAIFAIINNGNIQKYDANKALKYENKIISILGKKDQVTLKEVFDFSFHKAYAIEETYLAGEEFAKKYGLDISVEQMLPNDSDNIRRIVFVDENGEFVYEFRYNMDRLLCKDLKGKILYPNTIIRKTENLIETKDVFRIEFLVDEKDILVADDEYCINNYYREILSNYKNIIEDIADLELEQIIKKYPTPNSKLATQWEVMLNSITKNSKNNKLSRYGFVFKDINSDTTPELFWVDEDLNIFAVFSALHPSKNLLGAYSAENKCTLLIDGDLAVLESLDDSNFEYTVVHFEILGGLLKTSFKLGCEKGAYYKIVEDKRIDVDPIEFKEIFSNIVINNKDTNFRSNKIHFLEELEIQEDGSNVFLPCALPTPKTALCPKRCMVLKR